MTNKIRRVTCVILALVLLLSANAYAVDDLGESNFYRDDYRGFREP